MCLSISEEENEEFHPGPPVTDYLWNSEVERVVISIALYIRKAMEIAQPIQLNIQVEALLKHVMVRCLFLISCP